MGICWYCHWGWAKPVADIYKEACKRLDDEDGWCLKYGPSHIVWEDENFDCAELCLDHFDENKDDYSEEELEVVRWSLEELTKLPLNVRCPEPVGYDERHPELFPPTVEVVRT